MLATILICGAMTMLTSCSVDDNPVDDKTLASQLVGEWISIRLTGGGGIPQPKISKNSWKQIKIDKDYR